MHSTYFYQRSLKTLNQLGNIYIPENNAFPSYAQTGCIEHIDTLVENAPREDIQSLNILLFVLSFCPNCILVWLVHKISNQDSNTRFTGTIYRQLNLGLRGLIFSTYYSGKVGRSYKGVNPSELIGFSINRVSI